MGFLSFLSRYWVIFLAVGIFFFIPDPFDFVFGIGTIVEGIAGILGVLGLTVRFK